MKVLQINSVCGIRSTGRIASDIARILERHGDRCKIGYGREVLPENCKEYGVRIGKRWDETVHGLMSRVLDNTGFGSRRATKKFLKWVKDYDPDVIHLHNLHGYYIHIGLLFDYLKKANKPVVWTLHDCWAFTGHCAYFSVIGCEKWKNGGCQRCSQKKKYPSSLVLDGSKRNFRKKKELFTSVENMTLVTPSAWLADLAEQSFLGKYPVKVIHNGIDTQMFQPTPGDFRSRYGLENKKIILGVSNAWGAQKGLPDLLSMAADLHEDETLVLVGLGADQMKMLPKNVISISKTNSVQQLAEIYSAADVFANPTYDDNYPTVNLEAQCCGTPVVTYRTGGSVESVPEHHIVEQGGVQGLLTRLRQVMQEPKPDLYDVKTFSAKDRYEEYWELYQRILSTK